MNPAATRPPVEGVFPPLDGATGWLNSPPLTPAELRGRVVAVYFWTYTCVNWLRTAPYLRAWMEEYADQGLVVIGVHTPEFTVEHDLDNVGRAVTELQLAHPIAVDNDYAIWRAFGNRYWPALYLIDAQGRIRHHHFGEGGYEMSERVIRELLAEAGAGAPGGELVAATVVGEGVEAATVSADQGSEETYVGYGRTEGFASPGGVVPDVVTEYALPGRLRLNHWALSGAWTVGEETLALSAAPGRIAYRFHARDLNLVLGPATPGREVPFRVTLDGAPPGGAHGTDVDEEGRGTVTGSRLYQLIRQPGPVADRQFEIEFLDAGVEALVFTFG